MVSLVIFSVRLCLSSGPGAHVSVKVSRKDGGRQTRPRSQKTKLRMTPPPPLPRSLRCWAAAPFCLRSHKLHKTSSAATKYADAFVRVSSACLRSRTSRSGSRMRSFSAVVRPSRLSASRSVCWHHKRRLSGEHPSLDAIAWQAAVSLAYSARCSRNKRTPRAQFGRIDGCVTFPRHSGHSESV